MDEIGGVEERAEDAGRKVDGRGGQEDAFVARDEPDFSHAAATDPSEAVAVDIFRSPLSLPNDHSDQRDGLREHERGVAGELGLAGEVVPLTGTAVGPRPKVPVGVVAIRPVVVHDHDALVGILRRVDAVRD